MAVSFAEIAWYIFRVGFGLFSLASVFITAVIKNGGLWGHDTEEEKRELAAAQNKFWNLSQEPISGFRHAFFETPNRTRLHYVVNAREGDSTPKNVVIFVHGFPNSFVTWRHILQSPELLRKNVLIAVDLPGYGGSDSLSNYGPYEVLESLSEFFIGMRKLYLHEDGKVIAVTHDWGSLIGARLAAEAKELADHWIITSGLIPSLTASNARSKMQLTKQMLRTWYKSPRNYRLLKNGLNAMSPVLAQFRRSFYIFCFQLPWPFTNTFATFGNYWFLRALHSLGDGPQRKGDKKVVKLNPQAAAEAMAISTGPGYDQIESRGSNGIQYGESVRHRISDRGMSEKIRIYREGLFIGEWQKSLETTAALFELSSSSSQSLLASTAPKGTLRAPATIILGEFDPAFDRRLALDNARDYLVKGSQVIVIKGGGHWLPLEPTGRRVLDKTIQWALGDHSPKPQGSSTPFAAMSDVRVIETL